MCEAHSTTRAFEWVQPHSVYGEVELFPAVGGRAGARPLPMMGEGRTAGDKRPPYNMQERGLERAAPLSNAALLPSAEQPPSKAEPGLEIFPCQCARAFTEDDSTSHLGILEERRDEENRDPDAEPGG